MYVYILRKAPITFSIVQRIDSLINFVHIIIVVVYLGNAFLQNAIPSTAALCKAGYAHC